MQDWRKAIADYDQKLSTGALNFPNGQEFADPNNDADRAAKAKADADMSAWVARHVTV